MAQYRKESTRVTISYGSFINRFPQDSNLVRFCSDEAQGHTKGHPMKLELTRVGLLVYLANYYTTIQPLEKTYTKYVDKTCLYCSMKYIYICKILFNPELGTIPSRTNKIFKNRILSLDNLGQELDVNNCCFQENIYICVCVCVCVYVCMYLCMYWQHCLVMYMSLKINTLMNR